MIFIVTLSSCNITNIYKSKNTELKQWQNVSIFKDFVSPWDKTPFGETTFQYQNDDNWFYFLFKVTDSDIQVGDTSLNNELNALQSDRVELFFAKDSLMQPYYTFEMDASGRMFDARCFSLPKNKTKSKQSKTPKQINSNWDINKKDLKFTTIKTKSGYQIEGKIAMSFLKNEHLINNQKIWCGIQRANFSAKKSTQWICAKDPKTSYPDFHCWGVFLELSLSTN